MQKVIYPPQVWHESEIEFFSMDESSKSHIEFELNQEDDFLLGKSPVILPDNWAEEE